MRRPPSPGLVRAFLLTAAALSTAAPALGRCAAAGVRATAEPAASDSAATRSARVSSPSPGPAAAADLVAGGVAHASPGPRVYFGSAHHLRVVPPRVSMAPNIDGLLNDVVWAQAAVLDSFTQGRPIEAVPDSLGTAQTRRLVQDARAVLSAWQGEGGRGAFPQISQLLDGRA